MYQYCHCIMSGANDQERTIEARNAPTIHTLKKYLSAIQRKSKKVHAKVGRRIKKSVQSIKELGRIFRTESQSNHTEQVDNSSLKDKNKPIASTQYNHKKSLDKAEEFIVQLQDILEHTGPMQNIMHAAIVLFFYLVHNKYAITQTLREAEQAYHNSEEKKTDEAEEIESELVVYLVISFMHLSPAASHLLLQREKLRDAYFLLQATIIASLVDKDTNAQHSKEGAIFCVAVAECIRKTVEDRLIQRKEN